MRSSYFNAFTQIRIEYSVCFTATAQIHFPPSALTLSHTHRACLLVQEDVCSAHFNMNIIILYLVAIRFLVINQQEPAVFIPECWETQIT